jgi:hypothetical protein
MRKTGWNAIFLKVPLHAALAVLFLAMTLSQPSAQAMAQVGTIAGVLEQVDENAIAVEIAVSISVKGHFHAHKMGSDGNGTYDRVCDVQCAPLNVMLVDGFGIRGVLARCYSAIVTPKLADREPIGLTRPPKNQT